MTPEAAAFAVVRVALERLRLAALDAVSAVQDAEAVGVAQDTVLAAVKLDAEDWPAKLSLLKTCHDLLSAVGARTRLDSVIMVDDPLATDKEMAKYEFDQGFLAYHMGQPVNSCPYRPDQPAASSWREGWLEAKHAGND